MDYLNLAFRSSNTGFLRNLYYCKENKSHYCLQWDNGYSKPPVLYSATREGEASCPIKKENIQYFIFPEGHEHYHCILTASR